MFNASFFYRLNRLASELPRATVCGLDLSTTTEAEEFKLNLKAWQ